jgi:hypothetical protein
MILANLSAPGLTRPRDPLLECSVCSLFWVLSGFELAVAWACLFKKDVWLQLTAVFWLSAVLFVYWLGLKLDGQTAHFSLYLTILAVAFAVSHRLAFVALKVLFLYLLLGSGACLVWRWRAPLESRDRIRAACHRCGGHIEFQASNVGQSVPCPHCHATIQLHEPENLRMACSLCNGHIEFPPHAIGAKTKCPHCKTDITLKALT